MLAAGVLGRSPLGHVLDDESGGDQHVEVAGHGAVLLLDAAVEPGHLALALGEVAVDGPEELGTTILCRRPLAAATACRILGRDGGIGGGSVFHHGPESGDDGGRVHWVLDGKDKGAAGLHGPKDAAQEGVKVGDVVQGQAADADVDGAVWHVEVDVLEVHARKHWRLLVLVAVVVTGSEEGLGLLAGALQHVDRDVVRVDLCGALAGRPEAEDAVAAPQVENPAPGDGRKHAVEKGPLGGTGQALLHAGELGVVVEEVFRVVDVLGCGGGHGCCC